MDWSKKGDFHLTKKAGFNNSWGTMDQDWITFGPKELERPSKPQVSVPPALVSKGTVESRLLSIIAVAEQDPLLKYDSVHQSAKARPAKRPTEMTVNEIFAWIKQTPKQHHAIGRYQIIPKTLAGLALRAKLDGSELFDEVLQDQLGVMLLDGAGYRDFRSGKLKAGDFMDRLARVWAGLPLENGKSAYHGYAGNRSTVSRAWFEKEFFKIFPQSDIRGSRAPLPAIKAKPY